MNTKTKIGIAIAVGLAVYVVAWRPFGGVYVSVKNTGNEMGSVFVHVTGRTYALGDLETGAQHTLRVRPTGDSGVRFSYQLNGMEQISKIDRYFGAANYRGTIFVELANGEIMNVKDTVNISAFL